MQFRTILAAELMRRVRSRAFIIGLIFGGVGIAMITRLPALLVSVQLGEERAIALTGPPALVSPAVQLLHDSGFLVRRVPMPIVPPSQATLRRWKVSSLVVLSERGDRLSALVYAADPDAVRTESIRGPLVPLNLALRTHRTPAEMQNELGFPITVRSVTQRFADAAASAAAHAVAYLLLFLLYMLIIFNSQLVLTSVAEEKTSRIAEVLVASVNLTTLLIAKILASTVLAALQMATWVVIGGVLSGSAGPGLGSEGVAALTTVNLATIGGFLVFFILGFSQMSVLFAGIGSLVNRTEDLGSVSGPLFLPVIAAFIVAIMTLSNPEAPFAVVCSFVPILSPFVMFARIAVSTVPASQIVVACLIDVASVALFAVVGGRLYRVGMLLYGRTPSWSQIVRAMLAR